jgi:outer membrane protein assembly factor BamB
LRRIDAARGVIDWAMKTAGTPMPLLLSTGTLRIHDGDTLTSIDPASGSASPVATLHLYDEAATDPAIGSDGSLYFVYGIGVGTSSPSRVVSRVRPDGSVAWTSVNLATLGPVPLHGDVSPSGIALDADDTVIVGTGVLTGDTHTEVILALSTDTGKVRWTQSFPGNLLGGPLVAPDGSIVIALAPRGTRPAKIVFLDAAGQVRRTFDTSAPVGVFGLSAVALDGTLLAESDDGQGIDGLVAFSTTGDVLWRHDLKLLGATITSNDSVLAHDSFDVTLLDLASGRTKWVLSPPHPGVCISEAELTSAGTIVGLQCDGTLFGAAD